MLWRDGFLNADYALLLREIPLGAADLKLEIVGTDVSHVIHFPTS
jgi:hypothetical protein